MKNNPTATANALAVTGGIFYIACRILVGVFPDLMYTIAQSWVHGIGMASGSWNLQDIFLQVSTTISVRDSLVY